MIQYNTN